MEISNNFQSPDRNSLPGQKDESFLKKSIDIKNYFSSLGIKTEEGGNMKETMYLAEKIQELEDNEGMNNYSMKKRKNQSLRGFL